MSSDNDGEITSFYWNNTDFEIEHEANTECGTPGDMGSIALDMDGNFFLVAYDDDDDSSKGKVAYGYTNRLKLTTGTWTASWPDDTYQIKYGTTSKTGTGSPTDVWFQVNDFLTTTTLAFSHPTDTLNDPQYLVHDSTYIIDMIFTSTETDYFDTCNVIEDLTAQNELLVVTNNVELPIKYDGTTAETLGGNPPYGRYCMVFSGHLLLADCKDNATGNSLPQSVYWSARGEPEDWSGTGSGYNDLLDNDDKITGMELLANRAFIFKEKSIVLCTFTSQADPAFVFDEDLVKGVGAPSGRTVINNGKEIIFLASDNIYSFNGYDVDPIGDPVIDDILAVIDTTYDYKSHAVHLPTKNLYVLFIVESGQTSPSRCYVHNYFKKSWTIWEFAHTITSTCTLEDDTIMMGDSSGNVFLMDFTDTDDFGTDIDAYVDTKDFTFTSQQIGEFEARILESEVEARDKGGQIQIKLSTDHGNSWSLPVTISQDITEEVKVHIQNWFQRSRTAIFRISNVSSSEFDIEGLGIGVEKAGTNRR